MSDTNPRHRAPWQAPPGAGAVELAPGAVDVWRVFSAVPDAALPALAALLDDDERLRAGRLRFSGDRTRFVAAHAAMRTVLARYLGAPPGALRFDACPRGKPRLPGQTGPLGLRFNLSHSGDFALVAVARGVEVGVDVELLRDDFPIDEVMTRFFTTDETAAVRAAPEHLRVRAFFDAWVVKEAWLKARALGLSGLEEADSLRLLAGRYETVSLLAMPADYSAAVALESPRAAISLFSLPLDR